MADEALPPREFDAESVTAYSISEDGSTALFAFKDEDDQPVTFTIPVDKLASLLNVVASAKKLALQRALRPGQLNFIIAQSYSVGNAGGHPKAVLVGFDGGLTTETLVLIDDKTAAQFAADITANIAKRKIIMPSVQS